MLANILLKIAGEENKDSEHVYFPRPSMSGTEKCIRQSVFHSMGVPIDMQYNDRMYLVFDDGHWHEELTNDWIRKTAFQLHSEQMPLDIIKIPFIKAGKVRWCQHCNKNVPTDILHGHIDGIITTPLGDDVLFDHKAINHFTFIAFLEAGELPLDYFSQLALYAYGIQKTANPDLKDILLLIKNKNTAQYMEFVCHYDCKTDVFHILERSGSEGTFVKIDYKIKNIVKNSMQRFIEVDKWTKKKTLPKRQYYQDHWRCAYCRWSVSCWAGYTGEKKLSSGKFPKEMNPVKNTVEGKPLTKDLLNDIFALKNATNPGKTAEKIIKDYMRINNLLFATFGKYKVIRHETKTGDRFKFKEGE